jgi:hypothetical protein
MDSCARRRRGPASFLIAMVHVVLHGRLQVGAEGGRDVWVRPHVRGSVERRRAPPFAAPVVEPVPRRAVAITARRRQNVGVRGQIAVHVERTGGAPLTQPVRDVVLLGCGGGAPDSPRRSSPTVHASIARTSAASSEASGIRRCSCCRIWLTCWEPNLPIVSPKTMTIRARALQGSSGVKRSIGTSVRQFVRLTMNGES